MKPANLKKYYADRVDTYDGHYYRDDPIQLREQDLIGKNLQKNVQSKNILEVACGTGYWTQIASKTARSITATDAVDEVLQKAKAKKYDCPVSFYRKDAFRPQKGKYSAGIAYFWISHIDIRAVKSFLESFHKNFDKNAIISIADNVYDKKYGGQLVEKKDDVNTYRLREVKETGKKYLVLKNYFTKEELFLLFKQFDKGLKKSDIFYGKLLWCVNYKLSH